LTATRWQPAECAEEEAEDDSGAPPAGPCPPLPCAEEPEEAVRPPPLARPRPAARRPATPPRADPSREHRARGESAPPSRTYSQMETAGLCAFFKGGKERVSERREGRTGRQEVGCAGRARSRHACRGRARSAAWGCSTPRPLRICYLFLPSPRARHPSQPPPFPSQARWHGSVHAIWETPRARGRPGRRNGKAHVTLRRRRPPPPKEKKKSARLTSAERPNKCAHPKPPPPAKRTSRESAGAAILDEAQVALVDDFQVGLWCEGVLRFFFGVKKTA
jgi:hypothetical protein